MPFITLLRFCLLIIVLSPTFIFAKPALNLLTDPSPVYTSKQCVACHVSESDQWSLSDHAKAMDIATEQTVLGDFNNANAEHYSQKTRFFIEEGIYKATTYNTKNDQTNTYEVKYVFGHDPLQQYLVETTKGNLHVLPFAWNAKSTEQGGQRWYHLYEEDITSQDRLHWQQPLQNWNGMCADCHSDEVKRNYDPVKNQFNTTFTGINVGCVSCHGTDHNQIIDRAKEAKQNTASDPHQWMLHEGSKNAVWTQLNTGHIASQSRDNTFMDNCFACHSLRSPLTDGFQANTPFLDSFSPILTSAPNYFADGQIREEVYVYGSFLQSKMYANQVNCLDCHDPHTMKLKLQGNALCTQCHVADEYNTKQHIRHEPNTPGGQCVDCHMPDRAYMGIDYRGDHSFKIPRPDLSDEFGTPNACVGCHTDKTAQWASTALKSWFGEPTALSSNETNVLKARLGELQGLSNYLAIINDFSIPVITRATVVELLKTNNIQINSQILKPLLTHQADLIRLAAAKISDLIPAAARAELVSPLLDDELRAIRIAAVTVLTNLDVAEASIKVYRRAFQEYVVFNDNQLWRGEGRVNEANRKIAQGDYIGAEYAYKASIDIDPHFEPGYINLADINRSKQREDIVEGILKMGLEKNPRSADITYSYGLMLVRTKDIQQAIQYFYKAMNLNKQNPQLAYTYILALDGAGESSKAINELKTLVPMYTNNQSLIELGLYLSQKYQLRPEYNWFSQQS
ncbi:MAG: cytochrome c3 family protein [Glaciecola sp.]|jgi:predicted CXXCH cytochrome family protein